MKNLVFLLFLSVIFYSCSIEIAQINYGHDACDYCSMTIVDPEHSAQVVTNKGKNYKFDASECMINYLADNNNEDNMEHVLSANYLNPGEMMDANEATFIISEAIPSPMGANLSAIKNRSDAEELVNENGGEVFNWSEIKTKIKEMPKYNHHTSFGDHSNH